MEDGPGAIAHIIQLAIAPVFLLVGIAGLLNVMTGRLGRIIDRVRALEQDVPTAEPQVRQEEVSELRVLSRRMTVCQFAIASCTLSAVLVCVMVIVLFLASLGAMDFTTPVALLFIAVMAALTMGLLLFFAEVSISTRVVRVREEYRMIGVDGS
jgi:hypothetical protein